MLPLAYFGNPVEVGMIVALIALLFGGSKLAGLGKGLGQGIREFKNATHDEEKPAATPNTPVITQEPPVIIEAGRRNSSDL